MTSLTSLLWTLAGLALIFLTPKIISALSSELTFRDNNIEIIPDRSHSSQSSRPDPESSLASLGGTIAALAIISWILYVIASEIFSFGPPM